METYEDTTTETTDDLHTYVAENGTRYQIVTFPDSFFIPTRENRRNTFWNEREDASDFNEIKESCAYQLEIYKHHNPNATDEELSEYKLYLLRRFSED